MVSISKSCDETSIATFLLPLEGPFLFAETHLPGILIEVVYRYDHLISKYSAPKLKGDPVCAVGLQISLEKILVALAAFQAVSVKTLFKEQRSFGFWSPRRCDVYVVSYQPGYLNDRLEVAALLWRNNISADVMYESGLPDREHENHYDLCNREGILYVFPLSTLPPSC